MQEFLPIVESIVVMASWVAFKASLRTPSEQEARENLFILCRSQHNVTESHILYMNHCIYTIQYYTPKPYMLKNITLFRFFFDFFKALYKNVSLFIVPIWSTKLNQSHSCKLV